jgi:hypothetical protein
MIVGNDAVAQNSARNVRHPRREIQANVSIMGERADYCVTRVR